MVWSQPFFQELRHIAQDGSFLVSVEISGWRNQVGYVLTRGLARALLNCCFLFSDPAGLPPSSLQPREDCHPQTCPLRPTPNASNAAGPSPSITRLAGRWSTADGKKKLLLLLFFTFLLLTSTRHTVRLCHQRAGQTAVCDNVWRELGWFVEILHVLSFLLIDGELPVMNQSLMS